MSNPPYRKNILDLRSLNGTTPQNEGNPYFGEQTIAAERDFLVSVLDNMDALVVVLDHTGKIIRINRACERLFGYGDAVMRDKLTTGVLRLPGQTGALNSLVQMLRNNQRREHYETEWVDNHGIKRTIAWTINTFSDEHGQLEYVFASGIDISARKNAELQLRREQVLLKSLINSIPDMIYYKNLNGVYQGCNRVFEKLSGRQAKEVVGLTDGDIQTPDRAFWHSEVDRHVINTGNAFTYENWVKDSDGETILIETRITPYYSSGGETLGVIGVGRDVTRHHTIEQKLRTAKSELEQLIQSLSSIMLVLNLDGVITNWNPMAEKVFVLPVTKAIGHKLDDLPITWDWNAIRQGIAKCKEENHALYLDPIRFTRSNGQEGFIGVSISPLHDNQNKVSGYIFLCSDITERKVLENQLAQAQKLESIGRLAAGIAHEINTPIQYIGDNILFLQNNFRLVIDLLVKNKAVLDSILKDEPSSPVISELIEEMNEVDLDYLIKEIPLSIVQSLEGVQRVTEIVRAMKEFSHPGLKEKIPLDINKALMDTLTVTRNQWKLVAKIVSDLAPDLPKVMCQPAEINQVFLNIIINAAQAIETTIAEGKPGPGRITIQTRQIESGVEIRISDTGNGIPEEHRPNIFEPFFTTKDVGKGTGQGLALSYDVVVKKHNGSLSFESVVNEGTTFIIRLPIG